MKRIISVLLALIMTVLTACSCSGNKQTSEQYVIALNPSIMFEDGKVNSLRNTVASAIQKDIKGNNTTLYDNSNWKWVSRDKDNENNWYIRQVTDLSTWSNAFNATESSAPYSYLFGNNSANSLGVYDVEKMRIDSPKGAELNKNGYSPYYLYRQKKTVGGGENCGFTLNGKACIYNIVSTDETHSIYACGAGATTKILTPSGVVRQRNARYPYEYLKK